MPRKRKEIPKLEFESLLYIGCQRQEIVDYFDYQFRVKTDGKEGISDDTVDRWCKRTYHLSLSEMIAKGHTKLKIQLRRNQIKLSEKSAAMAIFLGKNLLGQTDEQTVTVNNHDDTIKEMDDYFEKQKRNSRPPVGGTD